SPGPHFFNMLKNDLEHGHDGNSEEHAGDAPEQVACNHADDGDQGIELYLGAYNTGQQDVAVQEVHYHQGNAHLQAGGRRARSKGHDHAEHNGGKDAEVGNEVEDSGHDTQQGSIPDAHYP